MASIINPANAVTASRFLTLPPFVWAVDHGHYQIAGLLIVLCGFVDQFDGLVARKFNCMTSFGEMFDAITDAVCNGFFVLYLAYSGWVSWTPVLIILAMGVANSGLRAVYLKRAGRTVNYKSYAMERLVGFASYLGGLAVSSYQVEYFYWTFIVVMAVVLLHDAKRMLLDPIDDAVLAGAR